MYVVDNVDIDNNVVVVVVVCVGVADNVDDIVHNGVAVVVAGVVDVVVYGIWYSGCHVF